MVDNIQWWPPSLSSLPPSIKRWSLSSTWIQAGLVICLGLEEAEGYNVLEPRSPDFKKSSIFRFFSFGSQMPYKMLTTLRSLRCEKPLVSSLERPSLCQQKRRRRRKEGGRWQWLLSEGSMYLPAQPNWLVVSGPSRCHVEQKNHPAECSQPKKLWNTANRCFKSLNFGMTCYKEFHNWNPSATLAIPNYSETTMSVSLHILCFCSCLCPLYELLVHLKDPTGYFLFCEVFTDYLGQLLFVSLDVLIYRHSTYFFLCPVSATSTFQLLSSL